MAKDSKLFYVIQDYDTNIIMLTLHCKILIIIYVFIRIFN